MNESRPIMKLRTGVFTALIFCLTAICVSLQTSNVAAQGLIWSLPEDGTYVSYEGTYQQTVEREQQNQQPVRMNWRRRLQIRSLGTEQADYKGEQVPCRWLEFEVLTGTAVEGQLEAGPGGRRIYKVLIPEQAIIGKTRDENKIPIEYFPMVKGYLQIGNNPPEPLNETVFQLYPVISMVRHFKDLEAAGPAASVNVQYGAVNAKYMIGQFEMESRTTRSKNTTELWLSDEIPFGVAKWTVNLTRERKATTDDRTDFKNYATINVSMEVFEVGQNAEATIPNK